MKLKSKIIISNSILLIFGGFMVFMALFYANTSQKEKTLNDIQKLMTNERKAKIKSIAEMAYSLLDYYYKQYQGDSKKIEKAVRNSILRMRYENGKNYVWIHRLKDDFMILHPMKKLDQTFLGKFQDINGKYVFKEFDKVCQKKGEGFVSYSWPKLKKNEPQPKLSYVKLYRPLGWIIGTGVYVDDIRDTLKTKKIQLKKFFGANLVKTGLLLLFISSIILVFTNFVLTHLFKPIPIINKEIEEISKNGIDLTRRLEVKSNDEISLLAKNLNWFLDLMTQMIENIKHQNNTLKQQIQTLSSAIEESFASANEMDASFDSVKKILERYLKNLDENNQALDALLQGIQLSESRYSQEEEVLEKLSLAMTDLKASTSLVKNNSEKTQEITSNLLEISKKGKQSLEEVFRYVEQIKENSKKIKTTTALIKEIAEKTDLLSMNAAIEAVRAGNAGKGFSVVADEIRRLAEDSARNSKEINKSVDEVIQSIRETAEKSSFSSKIFEEIFKNINKTKTITSETAISIIEESKAIDLMAQTIKTMNQTVSDNLKNNKQLIEQSEIIKDTSSNLTSISKEIKIANEEQSSGIKELKLSMEEINQLSSNLVDVNNELDSLINKFEVEEASFTS